MNHAVLKGLVVNTACLAMLCLLFVEWFLFKGEQSQTTKLNLLSSDSSIAGSLQATRWLYHNHSSDKGALIRTGWLAEPSVFLLDLLWFNSTTFVLISFNPSNVLRVGSTGALVGMQSRLPGTQRLSPVTELVEHLAPSQGHKATCTRVETKAGQIADNWLDLHLCHARDARRVENRTPSDIWTHSNRRRSRASKNWSVSIVTAVTSFTPYVLEFIEHAQNIRVEHVYLGICISDAAQREHGSLTVKYAAILAEYIEDGMVSLIPVRSFAGSNETAKMKSSTMCRLPAYQMALYHSKRFQDKFLFVSDLDEFLIPMQEEADIRMVLRTAVSQTNLSMENICFLRVHADQMGPEVKGDRFSLRKRFPQRCDCSPLVPLAQRENSNVGNACGVAYVKSFANVQLTFYASIHTHSACMAYAGSIFQSRPSDMPPARPWVDPDSLRIHHYVDMWKPRNFKVCNGDKSARLVPSEYATRLYKLKQIRSETPIE